MKGRSEARFRRAIGRRIAKRLNTHWFKERGSTVTRRVGASRTGCGDERREGVDEGGWVMGWEAERMDKRAKGGETRGERKAPRRLSCGCWDRRHHDTHSHLGL